MADRRVALITGGTRGIGLGIARALAGDGLSLALCGRRDESAVKETIDELADAGVEVSYCQADNAEAAPRRALVGAGRDRFGRLDVLVNNAGVAPEVRADLLDATEESFERLMRINVQGPFFLTQEVARWMLDQRREDASFCGCIVNVSSISATVASVNRGDYCMSKAALSMSTKLWAARLAEAGIHVYEIRPGLIETDMTDAVHAKYDQLIEGGLLLDPRWGTPEDVGRATAMLVRGDLAYATGQTIVLDGGMTLQRL